MTGNLAENEMTQPTRKDHPQSRTTLVTAHPSAVHGFASLADVVAPLWTPVRTQRALGLSRTAMARRRRTGSLLAVTTADDRSLFYPVFQFERRDGTVRVKPAMRDFMMALRGFDPWTIAVLLRTPAPELGDVTPLDWARNRSDARPLIEYAAVLRVEWAPPATL